MRGAGDGNEEAGLFRLDRKTGKTVWKRAGKSNWPAFIPGLVIFGDAALRLSDGKEVWHTEKPARFWSAAEGIAVGCFERNRIVGVDATTGAELWSRVVEGKCDIGRIPLRCGVAVTGGHVFAAVEPGVLLVLAAKTGKVVARRKIATKTRAYAPESAGIPNRAITSGPRL